MNQSKSILFYSAVCLIMVLVVLMALKVRNKPNQPNTYVPELSYTLTPSKTNLKVGDKVYLPIYLSGKDAYRVTAYDVKLYYDPQKFKLTKITPGGFFEKYLTVKWDTKNNWFALAMTPGDPQTKSQSSQPILTLELTAIGKTSSTPVSTIASQVYLTKTGGFHPTMGTANFSVR